jgi:hypothetical protein
MLIFVGIGVVLLLGAALAYLFRQRTAAKQAASVAWPTVQGEVTRAWVHSFRDNNQNLQYMARVKFAYEVQGRRHESERIAWGGRASAATSGEAQTLVDRYPTGSPVAVYYNPQKPKEAVLEPAETGGLSMLTWTWVGLAVIGLIFIAVGPFIQD